MALNLRATLGLDGSGFELGIKRAQSAAEKFSNSIGSGFASKYKGLFAAFGAASIATFFTRAVKGALELGGTISDLSKRSDISVESFQALSYGVEQAGGTMDDLAKAIKNVSIAQIEALAGNKKLTQAFARYGVTAEQLGKLNPEQAFRASAKGMGAVPASAQVTSDANLLFGKAADSILPAIRNGLIESAEEAERLGLVIRKDIVDELDRAGDAVETLNKKWKVLAATVTGSAIKNIRENFKEITNFMSAGLAGGVFAKILKRPDLAYGISKALFEQSQEEADGGKSGATPPPDVPNEQAEKLDRKNANEINEWIKRRREMDSQGRGGGINTNAMQNIGARVAASTVVSAQINHTRAMNKHAAVLENNARIDDQRYRRSMIPSSGMTGGANEVQYQ